MHTAAQIAELVGGTLQGPGEAALVGVAALDAAVPGEVTFITATKFAAQWASCNASAVLVTAGVDLPSKPDALGASAEQAVITVDNADLAMATVLEVFAPEWPAPEPGIHPAAWVSPDATLGQGVAIGPHCSVHAGVVLGDHVQLHDSVTVYPDCTIGRGSILWAGVVIRERCTLGERCILHPNVTIGADGFGYRPNADGTGLTKIPQIGTVEIGNDVEMGAGTCVDRGKFAATTIGHGTKIDNLCQIAHNVTIGQSTVMAALCAVAGSVTIGNGVQIGGMTTFTPHVTVGDGAQLAGKSAFNNDVPPGARMGGVPGKDIKQTAREFAALAKLPDLMRKLKKLESRYT